MKTNHFIAENPKINALYKAAISGNLAVISHLLESQQEALPSEMSTLILCSAARQRTPEVVIRLATHPSFQGCGKEAILANAIWVDDLSLVQFLMEEGADVHRNGVMPVVIQQGNLPILKCVLDQTIFPVKTLDLMLKDSLALHDLPITQELIGRGASLEKARKWVSPLFPQGQEWIEALHLAKHEEKILHQIGKFVYFKRLIAGPWSKVFRTEEAPKDPKPVLRKIRL